MSNGATMVRKVLLAALVVSASAAFAKPETAAEKLSKIDAQLSLADARSRIGKAIASPKVMGEIVGRLSAENQRQFLADVNKAIGDMPASEEEKAAKYLNANHAAVAAAKSGNVAAMIAEVFATVPVEALTVICERFAVDLVGRNANPDVKYSDEEFAKIAEKLMEKVIERTQDVDNPYVRDTFAIVMLVRASGGTPKDLDEKLVEQFKNDDAKDIALKEWLPSALGKDGRTMGFEPLLASADAGRRPDFEYVLVIAGPQFFESVLEDIVGKNADRKARIHTRTPVLDAVENPLNWAIPTLRGDVFGGDSMPQGGNPNSGPGPGPGPGPHPGPY